MPLKQFKGLCVAAALCATFSPAVASASLLWKGDFETGNLSQWSFKFSEKQLRTVATPVREGKFALEATAVATGDRVEVQNGMAQASDGTDRYYAWSVMTPKALGPNDHQTGYFETKNSYKQIMAFVIKGTDISLDTRAPNSQRRWTGKGKFTVGVWHDFVFHVKWSRDAATGLIELWFDGQKVLGPVSLPTLWDANDAFFQIGFLSGTAGEVIYIDEAKVATALEDVLQMPPPPPDAGVPVGGAGGGGGGGGQGGQGAMAAGGAGGAKVGGAGGSGSGGSGSAQGGDGGSGEGGGGGDGGSGGDDGDKASTEGGGKGCNFGGRSPALPAPLGLIAVLFVTRRRRR